VDYRCEAQFRNGDDRSLSLQELGQISRRFGNIRDGIFFSPLLTAREKIETEVAQRT
jgi:hypothetical protein